MSSQTFKITFEENSIRGFLALNIRDYGEGTLFISDDGQINGVLRLPNTGYEILVTGELRDSENDKDLIIYLETKNKENNSFPVTFIFNLSNEPILSEPVRIVGGTVVMTLHKS